MFLLDYIYKCISIYQYILCLQTYHDLVPLQSLVLVPAPSHLSHNTWLDNLHLSYLIYCWCSLENKCSLRGDCRDAALDPLYWISYKSGQCTTITSVQPNELQRTTARTLTLVIDSLPTLEGQFLCVFQALGKTLVTNATRTSNGVSKS